MNFFKKQKNKIINKKGFTLLFAVLVSTLVLAVGSSIINIALKQVVLSGVGRESQFAFYAANTGVECAFYWDLQGVGNAPVFATSSLSDIADGGASCAGYDLHSEGELSIEKSDVDSAVTQFELRFDDTGEEYYAIVTVYKDVLGSGAASTTISARGYNTYDTDNPRRIERGLELRY